MDEMHRPSSPKFFALLKNERQHKLLNMILDLILFYLIFLQILGTLFVEEKKVLESIELFGWHQIKTYLKKLL